MNGAGGRHLDRAWLMSWRDELNGALTSFLPAFEGRYGYPAGDNQVTSPGDGQAARRAGALLGSPPDLGLFYEVIDQVMLPDIGNGYFVHPAGRALDALAGEGPVDLGGSVPGVVFASDGGGILYAISPDGSVYRSATAARESVFELAATDLAGFLHQLGQAVAMFIATGRPGRL